MKKVTFTKGIFRTLFSHKGRFLGNFVVALFSVLITAGLGVLPDGFGGSYAKTFEKSNVPDIILTSKNKTGFTPEEVQKVLTYPSLESSEAIFSIDAESADSKFYRFYIRDLEKGVLDIPTLSEGVMPTAKGEVIALEGNNVRDKLKIGDTFSFSSMSLFSLGEIKVTGIGSSPLYTHSGGNRYRSEDPNEKRELSGVFYADKRFVYSFLENWRTDIYVRFKGEHAYLTKPYKEAMETRKAELITLLGGEDKAAVLTLEENESYALYSAYTDKIRMIGYIFPLFFFLLGALVNSITVNRLIQDERLQIGSYVSIGEPKSRIVSKYTAFSLTSVGAGAVIGYFVGVFTLPPIVLPAYASVFKMNGMVWDLFSEAGLFTALFLMLFALVFTAVTVWLYLRETPASLMREKAPKPGKRILLERIGFIWKKLSFSVKSMFRNIFRLKKNFFLTSLSVMGSTLLVFIGFALLNVSDALKNDELFSAVASSMGLISFTIVVLAMSMAVAVIYLLANMNIEDRKREIATLKVLGYRDSQCNLYCFREILFIAILASLVSTPFNAFITEVVFRYLGFGSISDVAWWSYVSAFGVIVVATFIVNLLLYHRIAKIDTTTSLQAAE